MCKPIIGIIGKPSEITYMNKSLSTFYIFENYASAVVKSGGIPVCILPTTSYDYIKIPKEERPKLTDLEKQDIIKQLKLCSGVIIPGGVVSYEYDYFIDDYLKKNNIPTFGICLGMQVMAINNNEIKPVKIDESKNHMQSTHKVIIKDEILRKIVLKKEIVVNSYHNYEIKDANGYDIAAVSDDGVIEAICDKNSKFRLGLQWHPEKDFDENEVSRKIFKSFIDSCKDNKVKKKHIIDTFKV